MTTDQLKAVISKRPFAPVVLRTTGGREYRVEHPELVSFSPGGRVVHMWVAPDAGVALDVLMIESIHEGEPRRRRRAG
jgi:hypothetical protein